MAIFKVTAVALFTTIAMTIAVLLSGFKFTQIANSSATDNTLVVHVFSDSDPQYLENLKFFVRYGVSQDCAVDYVIIVQTNSSALVRPDLIDYLTHTLL